jgi:hypothetical protein
MKNSNECIEANFIRRNAMKVLFVHGTAQISPKQIYNPCATAQSSDEHIATLCFAR